MWMNEHVWQARLYLKKCILYKINTTHIHIGLFAREPDLASVTAFL
jgi:hypothetical protein